LWGAQAPSSGREDLRARSPLEAGPLGQGYADEAARAVIDYAFGSLETSELFARHNPANHASRRLLEKLGFRYTHDEHYAPTGLCHPSYMLGRII
jgi:RimJ/RimL family protein N-acetyltransferase